MRERPESKTRFLRARPVVGPAGLLLATVALAACPRADPECAGSSSREQCAWDRGVRNALDADSVDPGASEAEGRDPRWAPTHRILDTLEQNVGQGLESEAVHQSLTPLCRVEPEIKSLGRVGAERRRGTAEPSTQGWTCLLGEAPRVVGRPLILEVGPGLASLVALELDDKAAQKGLQELRDGLQERCETKTLRPVELEEGVPGEFYRCELGSGSVFILGRFLGDGDAKLWQLSVAIVAGER